MEENNDFKDRRLADPYTDRRSGEDRRQVYDSDYWEKVGIERRSMKDRRQQRNVEALVSKYPNGQAYAQKIRPTIDHFSRLLEKATIQF